MVLLAFTEKPYEIPLCLAPPKLLTLKVLFYIAAASARRVSEIHALAIDPLCVLENPLFFLWHRTCTLVKESHGSCAFLRH